MKNNILLIGLGYFGKKIAEKLAEYLAQHGKWSWAAESVQEGMDMAIARALETDSVIVACGSLYMASEVRDYFGRNV